MKDLLTQLIQERINRAVTNEQLEAERALRELLEAANCLPGGAQIKALKEAHASISRLTKERDEAKQQVKWAEESERCFRDSRDAAYLANDQLRAENAALIERVERLTTALESFPSAGTDEAGTNDAWVFVKDWETWIEKRDAALAVPTEGETK